MSWAEPADMDTLSELPPPSVSLGKSNLSRAASSSGGRSSKSSRRVGAGGASKSERRMLMEAKAGVGAAIAEVRDPTMWSLCTMCLSVFSYKIEWITTGMEEQIWRENPVNLCKQYSQRQDDLFTEERNQMSRLGVYQQEC